MLSPELCLLTWHESKSGQTNAENPQWKTRLDSLLERIFNTFFDPWRGDGKVLVGYDDYGTNGDEYIAKGLFAADLAFVTMLAPYTAAEIIPRLQASAIAAARQCSGGDNHKICNIHWARNRPQSAWDSAESMEEQMSARRSSLPAWLCLRTSR
ncbi:hypothetical protein GB937_001722 [Aspergillus fischeri]|nr:hypothetical protein GB937_001722 [Aspergillus fischeri]